MEPHLIFLNGEKLVVKECDSELLFDELSLSIETRPGKFLALKTDKGDAYVNPAAIAYFVTPPDHKSVGYA